MPTLVPGQRFRHIALGRLRQCGIGVDDLVYCWGVFGGPGGMHPDVKMATLSLGNWWECGLDTSGAARCNEGYGSEARLVRVKDDPGFVSLSVGAAACGIARDARAYCWGENQYGQAGSLP